MDVVDVLARLQDHSGDLPLAAVASLQIGHAQTVQLHALGFSKGRIRARVQRGRLHRVHQGVYRVGYEQASIRGQLMAAVLACDRAALFGHSALVLWRALPPTGPPWHLSSPTPRRNRPGMTVHHTAPIPTVDLAALDRIPLTTPARALLELAEVAPAEEVEWALDEARAQRLIKARDLEELRGRTPGRHGWGALNRLLEAEREKGFSRSKAERRTLRLIRSAELPRPRRNAEIHGYEVDLLWPEHGVAVEFDSWQFHGGDRRKPFEHDRRKWTDLQARGLTVLVITWRQLVGRPEWVIGRLATALAVRRT